MCLGSEQDNCTTLFQGVLTASLLLALALAPGMGGLARTRREVVNSKPSQQLETQADTDVKV